MTTNYYIRQLQECTRSRGVIFLNVHRVIFKEKCPVIADLGPGVLRIV